MILLLYVNTAAVCNSSYKLYSCCCYKDDSVSSFMARTIDHVRTNLFKLGFLGGAVVSFTLSQVTGVVLEKQGFVSLTCNTNFNKIPLSAGHSRKHNKRNRKAFLISYLRVEL